MQNKILRKKNNGRSRDKTLQWIVEYYGHDWETWRKLAEEWVGIQDTAVADKLKALKIFFDIYLVRTMPSASNVLNFFIGQNGQRPSTDEFKSIVLEKTNRSDNHSTIFLLNYVTDFIEWVLITHFSQENDHGKPIPLYTNPFERIKAKYSNKETVYSPLPYRYICDLRSILCPKIRGHFSDWRWAQQQTGQSATNSGNWFEVDKKLINTKDKDCVWRIRKITRNGESITIYQIWSPIVSMALFLKLHLPLRTYQVRMLDSGEADTLRYEKGLWMKNPNTFALKHHNKGVFRQFKDNATGIESTGLYISTNKTSDQNKDEFERGYEIPWQHEDVLYWLEKLRNWQEKYNPISKPADCLTLESKHTGETKSRAYLSAMGHCCFIFRDASAKKKEDREKPIVESPITILWYKLLAYFETQLLNSGVMLSDGTGPKLVHKYHENYVKSKTKTEFPLHSLRVSLITCYIMDAKLPLPVVSKLLAGHSRIIMTVYYTKLTPAAMQEKMIEADLMLDKKSQDSIQVFLKDAEMRKISCKMAYLDGQAIEAALVNRNPLGWENRHHGLCLAGGNTVRSDECSSVAGCWNGGELVKASSNVAQRVYAAVPNGPENCVRCRWFITDARYIPQLNAHLNFMSYKAYEATKSATDLERKIDKLEIVKYEALSDDRPFLQHEELQTLQRRYEKQLVEADEHIKDWLATFHLIRRIIEIERTRVESDTTNKLIAVTSEINIKIGFMEEHSELLQLSLLCDDAELYPDMLDDVRKTSIIERRSMSLCRIMMRKGYMPNLLLLDQEQQLIAANAMTRQMALQANPIDRFDGYKQVMSYLELEQFMLNSQLLDSGIKALEENIDKGMVKLFTHDVKNKKSCEE